VLHVPWHTRKGPDVLGLRPKFLAGVFGLSQRSILREAIGPSCSGYLSLTLMQATLVMRVGLFYFAAPNTKALDQIKDEVLALMLKYQLASTRILFV